MVTRTHVKQTQISCFLPGKMWRDDVSLERNEQELLGF